MGQIDEETRLERYDDDERGGNEHDVGGPDVTDRADARWRTHIHPAWCIGENPNGGYALTPVLRALAELTERADPLSVTTHFLRPTTADASAEIAARIIRAGRRTAIATATLTQDGKERLTVLAAFGDLGDRPEDGRDEHDLAGGSSAITIAAPDLPPPEDCVDRRELEQGVALPILDRVEVRIHPEHARAGGSDQAELAGWIRFVDGTPPTTATLALFADAFPPAVYPKFGEIGWVPTIELTVHPRRRPVEGWVRGRFRCEDLVGDHFVESGVLWDASGAVVAQSRQLGLLLR